MEAQCSGPVQDNSYVEAQYSVPLNDNSCNGLWVIQGVPSGYGHSLHVHGTRVAWDKAEPEDWGDFYVYPNGDVLVSNCSDHDDPLIRGRLSLDRHKIEFVNGEVWLRVYEF